MSLILRQVIGYQQGRKAAPTTTPSEELTQTKKDLNSILNKWKWGEVPLRTSEEFLGKFEPWIDKQLKQQKEVKLFLAKKGVNDLKEAETKLTNQDLSPGAELTQLREELAQTKELWKNTEQDYLKRIEELSKEAPEDYQTLKEENQNLKEQLQNQSESDWEARTAQVITDLEKQVQELETEKDELTRDKITLEQEVLSLNNQVRNKTQEVKNQEQALEQLKKEKSELQKKYSKQGQLLDGEQVENNQLQDQITQLNFKITSLETEKQRLIEELNQTE